ncbi:hypothetical protein E4195_17695 [Pseudomonas putida]|nr:hypothetical protein E4195_17695 [Pseudomonas putida]
MAGRLKAWRRPRCGSGLVSRKGCAAAPAMCAVQLKSRGRFAAQSRHKAAPTHYPRCTPGFQRGLRSAACWGLKVRIASRVNNAVNPRHTASASRFNRS